VKTDSGFKHLADKYVPEGVKRFVDGRYFVVPSMWRDRLGYVMDNRVDAVHSHRYEKEINGRRKETS